MRRDCMYIYVHVNVKFSNSQNSSRTASIHNLRRGEEKTNQKHSYSE